VTCVDLKNAPHLNGQTGRVVQCNELTGRWQVDLGDLGVKALFAKNLAAIEEASVQGKDPEGSSKPPEPPPGDLIRRLLQSADSPEQCLNHETKDGEPGSPHEPCEEELRTWDDGHFRWEAASPETERPCTHGRGARAGVGEAGKETEDVTGAADPSGTRRPLPASRSHPKHPRQWASPPRSREQAVTRAERRLRDRWPTEGTLELIARFVREHGLCDEVELGLRMLTADEVRHITSSASVKRRLCDASDANEAVLRELGPRDPEAASIVQALRRGRGRRHRHSHAKSERQRSRSSHESRACSKRGNNHRDHRRREAVDRPAERLRRRERRSTAVSAQSPRAAATRPGGLLGGDAAGGGSCRSSHKELIEWLRNLDGGRGAMLRYQEQLQREFDDLEAVAAALLPKPVSSSVVGCVDPSLWQVLGIEALGHRLLFAKGIVALGKQRSNA